MGASDYAKLLAEKALELHREYITMSANFQNLERRFQDLVQTNERFIDRLARDHDDLKRRVLQLEALFNQVLATSTREALLQLQREHLQTHGTLADIGPVGGYESAAGPAPSSSLLSQQTKTSTK